MSKPGFKTTEFYLTTITTLLSLLLASGLVSSGGTADKIIGFAASALAVLGYTVSRGMVKSKAALETPK